MRSYFKSLAFSVGVLSCALVVGRALAGGVVIDGNPPVTSNEADVVADAPLTGLGTSASHLAIPAAGAAAAGHVTTGTQTMAGAKTFSTSVASPAFTSSAGSGSNAFACGTNGARIDFGAGASDYASSNGTTVTFAGPLAASNLSGTNTGDVTLAAVGAADDKGATISGQAIALGPADATHPGIVTTGTQTIAGAKTFAAEPTATDLTLSDTKAGRPTLTLNATDGKAAVAAIVGGSGEILAIGYDGSGAGITTLDLGPTAFADGGQIQMTSSGVTIAAPLKVGSSGTAISASYRATYALTPGALSVGSTDTAEQTLTSAAVGAECATGQPAGGAGTNVSVSCWVSSAGKVTFRFDCSVVAGCTGTTGNYSARVFNP